MVVRVSVKRSAEAVEKADGGELGGPGRSGARAPERGPNCPQEDVEHGAGHHGVVVQERPQALGDGEHPLSCGDVRKDAVGEVSGDLARGTHRRWVAGTA